MKTKWQAVLLAVFFIGLILVLLGYSWFQNKMARVDAGTARPVFPYADYSLEELEKLYPQYPNVDVATTQTPEETHKKLVEALKKQDFDGAVQWFVPEKRDEWKDNFQNIMEKGQWDIMVKDLDTKIDVEMSLDTLATYSYTGVSDGGKYGHTIEFEKNSAGVWLIESL